MKEFETKMNKIRTMDLWKAIGEQDIMKLRNQLGIIYSSRVVRLNSHKFYTKKRLQNHV